MGMLPPSLRIRPYDAAATASKATSADNTEEDAGFVLVADYFQDAPAPFAPGWTPKATDADATWQKCTECNRSRWEGWSAHGKWYCANCWRKWERDGQASSATAA